MTMTYHSHFRSLFFLTMLFLLLFTPAISMAQTSTRIVDNIEIKTIPGGFEIHTYFNLPLRYITHTPSDRGDNLQILLRPLSEEDLEMEDLSRRKTVSWEASEDVPLSEVAYEEGTPSGVNFIFRFSEPVSFHVVRGGDPRSLVVTVQSETAPKHASQKIMDSVNPTYPETAPIKETQPTGQKSASPAISASGPEPGLLKEERPAAHETLPGLRIKDGSSTTISQANQEPGIKEQPPAPEDQQLDLIMQEAKAAMTGGNYQRAIQLYTKLLQYPDHKFRQEAQEFLGLARERNGQLAHAKAEYEEYLRLYPEGESSDRVRQRLNGLITAKETPREKLRKAKQAPGETDWSKDVYGSFSQFYYRDASTTDLGGTVLNRSALTSDLDVNTRLRSDAYDIHTLFIGGYEKDFRDESDDNSRLSALYIDALDRKRHVSGRVGRQSRSTGGVLGRFDGGLFSYQPYSPVTVNLVAGYPVTSSTDTSINDDKHFYGLSFDLGTFMEHWNFNTFIINQEVDGISDRQAVGGETRYFDAYRSFFSLVDYDISYNELNLILFVGNWTFSDKTTFNMSLDYRKSPILMTSNALQGQGVNSIADLLKTMTEDEVSNLAQDRTDTAQSIALGVSRPLTDKLQISGDVTFSEMKGTEASGGVEAMPGTGTESLYSLQLIGSSLIKEGDIAIVGLSYSNMSSSNTISLNLNTRYPILREWRINPRFRVDYRKNKKDSGNQLKFRPSARMDYVLKRRLHLELEAGYEWATDKFSETNEEEKTRGYFWTVGYRIDF